MPSSNTAGVGLFLFLQCFWNIYIYNHCLLQVKMNLPVFLGGKGLQVPFLNKEGYGAVPSSFLKLCTSVGFYKLRSVCCLFVKQRGFFVSSSVTCLMPFCCWHAMSLLLWSSCMKYKMLRIGL